MEALLLLFGIRRLALQDLADGGGAEELVAYLFPDLPNPIFFTPLDLRERLPENIPGALSRPSPPRPPHPGNDPVGWLAYLRTFEQRGKPEPVTVRGDQVETSRRGVRF